MSVLTLKDRVSSTLDKTQKFLFTTVYGHVLEISYIDKDDGKDIICVPTQSGCDQGCLFCHMTGTGVVPVNLDALEIVTGVDEVRAILGLTGEKPLLVSYMGCGEPLCNPQETFHSMRLLHKSIPKIRFAMATILPKDSEEAFIQLGKQIKFENMNLKVHLSLHFMDDLSRSRWMPSTSGLRPSLDLLRWYRNYTGNRVEIHYTPIDTINDSEQAMILLAECVGRDIPVKLLQFNPKKGLKSDPSRKIEFLQKCLSTRNVVNETYTPPGRDIGASCGQFDVKFYLENRVCNV